MFGMFVVAPLPHFEYLGKPVVAVAACAALATLRQSEICTCVLLNDFQVLN
ncbi:hypothetical protein JCM19233_7297 [Vibrio astriarenae]|nr:hypothetical protein JCM19233_7297 [Vibrio sp. C7]